MNEYIQQVTDLSEMENAINTINTQISEYDNNIKIMNLIKDMDNLTTYFNNYMFDIQTVSLSFKTKLEAVKTYYDINFQDDKKLTFITDKYNSIKNDTGHSLYNDFKSFKDNNCNAECKSNIDTYIDKSTTGYKSQYNQLLSQIKEIKSDENINIFVYDSTNPFPYSIYRQLANNVKTELPNYSDELDELISFLFIINNYYYYFLNSILQEYKEISK